MDKKKWLNWIDNVLEHEGASLSYGSVRALSDLKREISTLPSSNSDYEKCHALACKIVNEYDFDTSEELLAGFIQRHFA